MLECVEQGRVLVLYVDRRIRHRHLQEIPCRFAPPNEAWNGLNSPGFSRGEMADKHWHPRCRLRMSMPRHWVCPARPCNIRAGCSERCSSGVCRFLGFGIPHLKGRLIPGLCSCLPYFDGRTKKTQPNNSGLESRCTPPTITHSAGMDPSSVPDFDDLPKVEGQPQGCAWGIFDKDGQKDVFGTLNFLTPEIVAAAAAEVKDGISISLKWVNIILATSVAAYLGKN